MKRFLTALQFLTVFPVKKGVEAAPAELSASMAYFPLVGALQGVILVVAYFLISGRLPAGVVAVLLLIILAVTGGGLHLDGFVDTVDGLAGGRTPEERMRIMRDSSTGAVGAAFLALFLILKFSALKGMPEGLTVSAVFLFPVMGRWAMVLLSYRSRYARAGGGVGTAFTGVNFRGLIWATLTAAVFSVFFLGAIALLDMALVGVFVYLTSRYFKPRLGGVTGDVFGFQCETAEVFFLLLILAL